MARSCNCRLPSGGFVPKRLRVQKRGEPRVRGRRDVVQGLGGCAAGVLWLASAAPACAQSDSAPLGEIVVTARKTAESLSETPLSVTTFDAAEIAAERALRLSDINTAPGFSVEKTIGVDTILIRGVGGGGRNIGFGSRVGVYLDGVFIGQVGALNPALNDLARVEILSGPQGTLFGRNAVAGAVSLTSAPPNPAGGASVQVRAGSAGDRGLAAKVEGAMGETAAVKLSAGLQHRDGFVRNLAAPGERLGGIDLRSARTAVRLRPAASLTVDLAGDLSDDRSPSSFSEAVSDPFGRGGVDPGAPRRDEVSQNVRYRRENRVRGVSAVSVYQPREDFSLTWIAAERRTSGTRTTDNDYSALDILSTRYVDRYDQGSNEVRAAGRWRAVRYVAGAQIVGEDAHSDRAAVAGPDAQRLGLAGAYAHAPLAARMTTRTRAAFVSADVDLTRRLVLNLGVRLNDERRRLWFDLDGSQSGGFDIGVLRDFRDRARERSTTPTASLTYRVADAVHVYTRYAQGFKSGGWNVDFLSRAQLLPAPGSTATPFAFRPESVESLEAGTRFATPGKRVSGSLAVFGSNYGDYQVNQFSTIGGRTVIRLTNAASARTRGVEFSGRLAPAPALVVSGNLSLLRARFGSFAGGGEAGADASGNRLAFAPRTSGALRVAYRPRLGEGRPLEAAVSYRYRSWVFSGQENTADQRTPRASIVDGSLIWRPASRGWSAELWVDNLFNDRAVANRARDFLGTQTVVRTEPRRIGLTLSAAI